MNVYDFDKTIYKRDSSTDFIIFLIKKKPKLLGKIPGFAKAFFQYKRGEITKTRGKERVFAIISHFQPIEPLVNEFWSKKKKHIAKYYLDIKQPTDIVISASPEFLLKGICKELGVATLIGSPCDEKTGRWTGENCYGEQKVVRFREQFPNEIIDDFYSDSRSDTPLALISKRAYLVKGESLSKW